jgi:hypothetical protein
MDTLLPELIEAVADQLALAHRPQTLLSLSLASRRLNQIIHPHLLYRDVRLEGEDIGLATLARLLADLENRGDKDEQPLGHYVRRLYISSPRSFVEDSDVLTELRSSVSRGVFLRLQSLSIVLRDGWQWDEEEGEEMEMTQLDLPIWQSLKMSCPNLQDLCLSGLLSMSGSLEVISSACVQLEVCPLYR